MGKERYELSELEIKSGADDGNESSKVVSSGAGAGSSCIQVSDTCGLFVTDGK